VAVVLLASAMVGAGCRSNHPSTARTGSTAAPPATTATFAATIPGGGRPSATQLDSTARILQARMAAAGIHGSARRQIAMLLDGTALNSVAVDDSVPADKVSPTRRCW
jgi:hypothetical protein